VKADLATPLPLPRGIAMNSKLIIAALAIIGAFGVVPDADSELTAQKATKGADPRILEPAPLLTRSLHYTAPAYNYERNNWFR